MMEDNTESILRTALESHGAREFEVVALSMDAHRGLAAFNVAVQRGADNPIQYAIALFDKPDWQPKGETRRVATNQSVERTCAHCGGDRFVPLAESVTELYVEQHAPCKVCNPTANTRRWVGTEARETAAA